MCYRFGTRIVTAAADGTTYAFVLSTEELVAPTQSCVTRLWTTEECQKYLHMEECPERP